MSSEAPPNAVPALCLKLPPQLCVPRSLEVLLQHDVINQPSALVRASVTRLVLPFFHWEWAFSPDWFFWILHAATGFDLLWDARVLIKYRVHSSSLSWVPEKDQVRRADVRLVPLVALRTAAQFSRWGAESWSRWGRTLYWRWLRQAVALKAKRGLKPDLMQLAATLITARRGNRCHCGASW